MKTDKPYFATLKSAETELLNTASEIAVWFAVKSYAGTGTCFASVRQLAKRAHASKDTVQRAVGRFISIGMVQDLGTRKSTYGHWATHWLKLSDGSTDTENNVSASRTDEANIDNGNRDEVSAGETQVSDTASKVSDFTDTKYKGNINKSKNISIRIDSETENKTPGEENTAIQKRKSLEYGNPQINECQSYFLQVLQLPKEDGNSMWNRRHWNNLLRESNRGVSGVKGLIDLASADSFYRDNITNAGDLWKHRIKLIARRRGQVPRVAVMPKEVMAT
jgi:hypothetical protein